MRTLKMAVVVMVTAALGMGLAGCGTPYTGEGIVVDKQIEKTTKKSSKRSSSSRTDYEITLDIPNSKVHKIIDVPKEKYDSIQIGQKLNVEKGKLK